MMMMNINVGEKYRTVKPTEHDEYYYGYWTLPQGSIVKVIGEFPNILNAVRFEVLSGEMKSKKIAFNKNECTSELLQKLLTTDEKKTRTLANIHKLKRENRVLSSRVKAELTHQICCRDVLIRVSRTSERTGRSFTGMLQSLVARINKSIEKVVKLSQRIGSNGNKIQRLRTKLSQSNKVSVK